MLLDTGNVGFDHGPSENPVLNDDDQPEDTHYIYILQPPVKAIFSSKPVQYQPGCKRGDRHSSPEPHGEGLAADLEVQDPLPGEPPGQ